MGAVVRRLPNADGEASLLAVEMLPGQVQAATVAATGRVTTRHRINFDPAAERPEIFASLLAAALRASGASRVTACAIAAGGVLDTAAGSFVEVVDMPALQGFPIAPALAEALGVPTLLEHRARLQVHGDHYFGPGQGHQTFASVSTGSTLGVGILYQGNILAPDGGRSGAHMTVTGELLCSCGKRGCWRTVATTSWLRDSCETAGLGRLDLTEAEVQARTNPVAARLVAEYAENLAAGLANIQQLCTPGLFILHGEAATASQAFRDRILQRLRELSRTPGRQPTLRAAEVTEDDVALLGAAALLVHRGVAQPC